uniref:G-protein coupled receptors family 1 profile domain-containing protein n=1 Tax=Pygocentrus nattereri TaxID=42514 RepID=A0AAR2KYP9_PYGNA
IYTDETSPCDLNGNHGQQMTIQTFFICALGLVGNVLVLVPYTFYRKAKTMTDIYLVNQYSWRMGSWAGKLLTGTYSINLYCSMLLLACINGDRYVAIVKASRSIEIHTKPQIYSRLICSIIWLLAIALSLPTFIFYDRYEEKSFDGIIEAECVLSLETGTTTNLMRVLVPSTQVTVGFFVPMPVMGFCYCSIVLTLLKNILLALAYLHCCINPILYAFIGEKFRNHFCQITEDLWCLRKRYFSSVRSSQQTSEPIHLSDESNHESSSSFTI